MPTREEMQGLAQEIVRSHEDRISAIAQLRAAVKTELKGFDDAHAAMSQELKADLSRVAPTLREAEAERQRTAAQEIAQRKSDMSAILKGFNDAHAAMSQELKADLAKVAPALRGAEAERKRTEARQIAQRKSDVGAMLRGFDEEQAGARDEWQKLTATMQAKRGVLVVERSPEATVPPPPEEVTPKFAALRRRVFAYLADHPDGTRMTELEKEFGVGRIEMARVTKSLMDEGKVKKQGPLYFAI